MTTGLAPEQQDTRRAAAAVRAWVRLYTRGLPEEVRSRRREQVAADLADEALEFAPIGPESGLATQQLGRLVRGIPADISWRLVDAGAIARASTGGRSSMPASRLSVVLLGIVGMLAFAGLVLMLGNLDNAADPDRWQGWGRFGLVAALILVLVGVVLAIPRPHTGTLVALTGAFIGFGASPWLWPAWLLVPIVVGFRMSRQVPDEAETTAP